MNTSFPLLSIVSFVLRAGGVLFALVGLVYAVCAGMIEPQLPGHHFDMSDGIDLVSGGTVLVLGVLAIAYGELLGVLFAIEANTRRLADRA